MKVRLMIIIGVISFLLGGCNKIQKNSNQVQLVQRTEEILVESEDLADDYFHITLNTRLPWSNNEPMAVGNSITTTDVNPFFNY